MALELSDRATRGAADREPRVVLSGAPRSARRGAELTGGPRPHANSAASAVAFESQARDPTRDIGRETDEEISMKHANMTQGVMLAAATALLLLGLSSVSCGGKVEQAIDNVDSAVNCYDYCIKKADCNDERPSNEETRACVRACRDSIEDGCGNEHQAAANETIEECIDVDCAEFWDCMVFDPAPECFGFVDGH
jgi:hypothetical protein